MWGTQCNWWLDQPIINGSWTCLIHRAQGQRRNNHFTHCRSCNTEQTAFYEAPSLFLVSSFSNNFIFVFTFFAKLRRRQVDIWNNFERHYTASNSLNLHTVRTTPAPLNEAPKIYLISSHNRVASIWSWTFCICVLQTFVFEFDLNQVSSGFFWDNVFLHRLSKWIYVNAKDSIAFPKLLSNFEDPLYALLIFQWRYFLPQKKKAKIITPVNQPPQILLKLHFAFKRWLAETDS